MPGLKDVPPDQRPPVWPVFFSFRIMVGIGLTMLAVSLWSLYLRWKGALFTNRLFLHAAMLMTPSGFGAVLFGWFTAEIGRQPYVVYGHLRTADAVSPVTTGAVTISLATFVVAYLIVFGFGSYYLAKILRKGPDPVETMPGARQPGQEAKAAVLAARRRSGRRPRTQGAPASTCRIGRTRMFGFGTEYVGWAFWLPLLWSAIFGVAITMYVIVDGFDLGIGIMFTNAESDNWRDRMMFSVAPIWDGNETWLILGGAGLFCVFSVAYAILMPALYIPMLIMLIALIFRGIAFEFRFKADTSRRVWDYAFHYGSLLGDLCARHRARRFRAGLQGSGHAVRRRHLGLADALQHGDRRRSRVRLRSFGLDVVRDEDHRRTRNLVASEGASIPDRHDRDDGDRERLGAFPRPADRGAVVLLAQHRPFGAGAASDRLCGLPDLSDAGGWVLHRAVPALDRHVPARIPGPRH